MNDKATLLFFGCGNMGSAVIKGARAALPGARIVVVNRNLSRAQSLLGATKYIELFDALSELPNIAPSLTFLGIKPQQFSALGKSDVEFLGHGTCVSIMAGLPATQIAKKTGNPHVVRVMPNLPTQFSAGISLGCHSSNVSSAEHEALISSIFGQIGLFEWVEHEDILEAAQPIYGCGPGLYFAIVEQFAKSGEALGLDPDLSTRLARQMLTGVAETLSRDPRNLADLKQAVASPGGTTEAGLKQFDAQDALSRLIQGACVAARERARELASGSVD